MQTQPVYNDQPPYNIVGSQTVTASDYLAEAGSRSWEKSSARLPFWHKAKTTGVGMNSNNFSYRIETRIYPYGWKRTFINRTKVQNYETGFYRTPSDFYIGFDATHGPTLREIEGVKNDARRKCLEHMKDQKINLAQAFAERQQTADSIASTLVKLASLIRNIKSGNFPGAMKDVTGWVSRRGAKRIRKSIRDVSNEAAGSWLHWQYAIRPLLQDIRGAAEAIAKSQYPQPHFKSQGVASVSGSSNKTILNSFYGNRVQSFSWTYTFKVNVHYHGPVLAVPDMASLGLLNPLTVGWELFPWSFVADWALPIGSWLNTFDASAGLVFEYGSETTVLKRRATMSLSHSRSDSTETVSEFCNTGLIEDDIKRVRIDSFPMMQFPQFKNPLSLEHLANAAALVRTATRHRY